MNCLKCRLNISDSETAHYGLHSACFQAWFNKPAFTELVSLRRHVTSSSSGDMSEHAFEDMSFFQGKFKKYSAELNGDSYIIKMRQKETPELPEVEYLCNQIGMLLGLPVADFYFIDFLGERVFVTKSFISLSVPMDLQHLCHFRPNDQHSCEGILHAITKHTQLPRRDVGIFIRTLLFDALIGNHDRHGRNLAFILTTKDTRLSPIYDNVSYLSLESGDMLKANFNPTGRISTKASHEPSMREYVKELQRLGYQEDVASFYNSINFSEVLQLIDESFCSALMKAALQSLIKKRFEELEDALNT